MNVNQEVALIFGPQDLLAGLVRGPSVLHWSTDGPGFQKNISIYLIISYLVEINPRSRQMRNNSTRLSAPNFRIASRRCFSTVFTLK